MDIGVRSRCETGADKDAYTFSASLKRFFNSSKFTDLTIRTADDEFKVHKMVVCGQSEYFTRMFDGEWKEAVVDLTEDDPRTVEAMIHFMYESDYDGSGSNQGRVSPMLFNARAYGVSQLKQRAKVKFENAVRTCWDMDDFAPVIIEVYTSTLSTDRGLRNVLADTAHNHIGSLLQKDSFVSALENCAGFSADVLQLLAGKLPSTTKYNCPSCDGTWEGKLPQASGTYFCLLCGHDHSDWSAYALEQTD